MSNQNGLKINKWSNGGDNSTLRSTADELGVSLNIGFANALTPSSGEAYNNKKKQSKV